MGYMGAIKKSPNSAPWETLGEQLQYTDFCVPLTLARLGKKLNDSVSSYH